jgi:hypothetical protein
MVARRSDLSSMMEMLPPFAFRVAATLRLSDHIGDDGRSTDELALATGANPDALARLLRYLCCLGLYRQSASGRIELTPAGRMLAQRRPVGLQQWLDLDAAGGRMDLALAGLLHSVRTGESGYPAVFARSFWDDLAAAPELAASFDALMAAKSSGIASELAALDFTGVSCLVDVGGGSGLTLTAILRAHPRLRGVLVERSSVVERARHAVDAADLAGRCDVVGADILTAVPGSGDAYLLFDILHNWDDATAETILRHCALAAGPAGRVLIVEDLPVDAGDRNGCAMDLKMLVLFGGRQRNADELGKLVGKVGLRVRNVARLPSGFAVVEAVSASNPAQS